MSVRFRNLGVKAMPNTSLRVVGAGLPRTGTSSLRLMLSDLLNGPCYHMKALYERPDVDGPKWMAALAGDLEQLDDLLAGWSAAVDWPASVLWRQMAERYPDALVVLSHRGSAQSWWESADRTVWHVMRGMQAGTIPEHVVGLHELMRDVAGFSQDLDDAAEAQRRYDEHHAEVIATIPEERLLLWEPDDGWEPLCERLGVPVPEVAPVHVNSAAEFLSRHRADGDSDRVRR